MIIKTSKGPFRWICTSGCEQDLAVTDGIAEQVLISISRAGLPENIALQVILSLKSSSSK